MRAAVSGRADPLPASGLQILAGGLLVLLGIWTDVGAILLAAVHVVGGGAHFWRDKEPMARMNEMVQFQKDMALTGASLILLYLAWTVEDLAVHDHRPTVQSLSRRSDR